MGFWKNGSFASEEPPAFNALDRAATRAHNEIAVVCRVFKTEWAANKQKAHS